ncbi:hypothetical protein [Streptomyces sp. NPDC057253]|uniref:hypothetical protein n=1 Tax=Streptomyces sp. NPDC057253 TaxID=3346069 RepID=UPI00363649D8
MWGANWYGGSRRPVSAMPRRPARARFPAGMEAVYGDAADPASLDAAFAGVHGVFFADRAAASVDPADLAQIAAPALTTGDHAGAVHELSGPQALTPTQEPAILGEILGRDLRVRPVTGEAARTGMARYGFPPEVVDAILHRALDGTQGAEVLPTAEKLLGRPPRTHRTAFGGGRQPSRPAAAQAPAPVPPMDTRPR